MDTMLLKTVLNTMIYCSETTVHPQASSYTFCCFTQHGNCIQASSPLNAKYCQQLMQHLVALHFSTTVSFTSEAIDTGAVPMEQAKTHHTENGLAKIVKLD